MSQPRYHLIVLFCLIIVGCIPQGISSKYKAPLGTQGEVMLYLQPMPQEAGKLRFSIDEIFAVRDDGFEAPFSLFINDFKGADLKGIQKQLASAILPPGPYSGLSIRIKQAFIDTEDGDVALLVPDEPVTVDHGFDVERGQVASLFLSLKISGTKLDGVSFRPAFSLASSGRALINLIGYVTNSESNFITVFDKNTMQVVATISTGQGPGGMVLDQIRTRAYVAASRDNIIEVIDVFKGVIINRLRLNLRDRPIELALTPDGKTLLSVNNGSNTVSIIDALSMIEIARVNVGEGPTSAVIDPSGFRAFVLNSRSSTISVIDLTQRGLALTIGVESAPLRAAFSQAGDKLFVISSNTPNLAVVDMSRLTVSNSVFIGIGAASIKVDHQTGNIYVGKRLGGEITVIDPFALVFIDSIAVGGQTDFMTIDDQKRTLFAVLGDKNRLSKINLISKEISANIDVGQGAFFVVVMGER
jgi:YVTN family beta-propeller protein